MNALVHSGNVKYAVIQASGDSDLPVRLVHAYPDEHTLRSLMAEPSIVGYDSSRSEEAAAVVAGNFNKSIATRGGEQQQRVNDNRGCSHCAHAYSAIQFTFASAVLVLYSKNIVSSIIQTILGL